MSDSLWIWSIWLMVLIELAFGLYMVATDKEKSA